MWLLRGGIVLLLVLLFYQDIKSRTVWVWLFPLIAIGFMLLRYFQHRALVDLDAAINIGLLAFQLLLVSVYFSVRQGQVVNITKTMLGWGDILFLVCIAFYLAPLNYFFFYISSLIVVLLFWVMRNLISQNESEKHIPLAGLQAFLFTLLFTAEWIMPGLQSLSNEWLLEKLT